MIYQVHNKLWYFALLSTLFLLIIPSKSYSFSVSDSSKKIDSLHIQKSIKKDTTELSKPLNTHGSMFLIPNKIYARINKRDLSFTNYIGFSDIIYDKLPVVPLSLGIQGQFNHFSLFGSSPNNTNFRFNNRSIMDFDFGSLNPEQISTEFFENIEVLTGSDAVIFGNNSSGALINIQERIHNSATPFTHLRYNQAGYEFIGADGIFSQNIKKNLNFTFGFNTQSSAGRYKNNEYDRWNLRGILRWNPDDRTSISLVENFSNHKTGLNGGINTDISRDRNQKAIIYDDIFAIPHYQNLIERNYRHNLTLTLSKYFSADSSKAFNANIFISNALWEYERDSTVFINKDDKSKYLAYENSQFGASGKYEHSFSNYFILRVGGEISKLNLPGSVLLDSWDGLQFATFAHGQINPTDKISFSGGIRTNRIFGFQNIASGAKLNYLLSDKLNVLFDLSISERSPSLAEGIKLKKETTNLALAEIKYSTKKFSMAVNTAYRRINSPILTRAKYNDINILTSTESYNASSRDIISGSLVTNFLFLEHFLMSNDKLFLSGKFIGNYSKTNSIEDKVLPALYASMKFTYAFNINRSLFKGGAEFKLFSPFKGQTFIPFTRTYTTSAYLTKMKHNGIDIFISLKLGNAFLQFTMQNILSSQYYTVPFYPHLDRNFRFSVSWSFFD